MRTLIRQATLVTVDADDRVLEDADLAIADDKIVGVGAAPEGFVPDRVLDGRGCIVLPGLVNTHTHLSMTLMRNYADDLAFWPWLLERVKPLEDHLVPEDVRIGARLGIAELIRGGTTCFHDMYFFLDEVADEVERAGFRACLCGALFDNSGQGDALLTPPAFITALRDHMRAHPDTQVATVAIRASAETYRHLADDAAQGRVGGTTVVLDAAGHALYFSKRILPYLPDGRAPDADMPILLHLGLYAYRRAALERYVATGVTMLETVEGLEQLRFLVGGTPVTVLTFDETGYPIVEVNNPSDIPIVEGILSRRGLA